MYRWEDLNEFRRNVSDSTYIALNNRKIGLGIFGNINKIREELLQWLDEAAASFNGRPLPLLEAKKECKKEMSGLSDMVAKYGYLFSAADLHTLQSNVEGLEKRWTSVMKIYKSEREQMKLKVI